MTHPVLVQLRYLADSIDLTALKAAADKARGDHAKYVQLSKTAPSSFERKYNEKMAASADIIAKRAERAYDKAALANKEAEKKRVREEKRAAEIERSKVFHAKREAIFAAKTEAEREAALKVFQVAHAQLMRSLE